MDHEFDESDMWNLSSNPTISESKKTLPSSGSRSGVKRGSRKVESGSGCRVNPAVAPASSSMPVNVPDWSNILKEDYKERVKWESYEEVGGDEDEGDGYGEIRIPPHEYLARKRGASLSVHEGIGRTLKGRDLRSVRNAIWKKVGFED